MSLKNRISISVNLYIYIIVDATKRFLEIKADSHFVKTSLYDKAEQVLQNKNLLFLTGNPGEGKTTMAAHLALDVCTRKENCIKLESARDWADVNWSLRYFTTVIIDDIFGGISLDHERLREWKTVLNDIVQIANDNELKVIITSRHYIKEEARYEMDKITMFNDSAGYTVHLDSRDLSSDEMKQILDIIIKRNGIDGNDVDVDMCVTKARGAFNFKLGEREDSVFGFPECAVLFATETLKSHGSDFFKSPEYHFKAYIEQLYNPKETYQFYKFIALVAVWAEKEHTIKEIDLQNPQNVSTHINNIANCFGIKIDHEFVECVRFSLNAYTRFLLIDRNDSGEYTFSHNVIGEMVGVVLGKYKPRECIKLCERDFFMKRVTIIEYGKNDLKVTIPERKYTYLFEKFIKLLVHEERSRQKQSGGVVDRFVNALTQAFVKKCIDVDIDILCHEAFGIKPFVELFTKYIVDNNLADMIFNTRAIITTRHFVNSFTLTDIPPNNEQLYLLDQILLKKHIVLAEQILLQIELFLRPNTKLCSDSVCVIINELPTLLSNVLKSSRVHLNSECSFQMAKYLGAKESCRQFSYPLIVATSENKLEVVKCLLKHGAWVNVKDCKGQTALHMAAQNKNLEIMKELLNWKATTTVMDHLGQTPLHCSAEKGDLNAVTMLLRSWFDVYRKDCYGRSALHCAASGGHSDVLTKLLDSAAYVDAKTMSGSTSLHFAASGGHLNAVQTCLKYGADVNITDNSNRTALACAAHQKYFDVVKELLDHKADVNVKHIFGYTPLHFAALDRTHLNEEARVRHLNDVQMCLKYGADVNILNDSNQTALHVAVYGENCDIVKELLEKNVDVNAKDINGKTALHNAAEHGSLEAVLMCLKYSADVNMKCNCNITPFHYAALGGHVDIMGYLLNSTLDVNARDIYVRTPLHIAYLQGNIKAFIKRLKSGADINMMDYDRQLALHIAASCDNCDMMKELLDNKSDVNSKEKYGTTPLHVAAYEGHLNALKICLNNGADVNLIDDCNNTALHYATSRGHHHVIKELLDSKADVNAKDKYGRTPLHNAAFKGFSDSVKICLEHGANVNMFENYHSGHRHVMKELLDSKADVNAEDKCGRTPLHNAAAKGNLDCVKLCLEYGANVNMVDNYTISALHSAAAGEYNSVFKVLLDSKADVNAKDILGKTPLHYAVHKQVDGSKCVETCLKYEADVSLTDCANKTALDYAVADTMWLKNIELQQKRKTIEMLQKAQQRMLDRILS